MNLLYIAYRNMVSKPLSMVLSLVLLVLSVSLVTFILQLSQQINGQMAQNIGPVDMVVGAKGSPLQLVLSSVLHIDAPTGNISLNEAQAIKNHPFVGSAIPISYGDNYRGYRILGTEHAYLENYQVKLSHGRLFQKPFELVVGNAVAKKLELKIGDKVTSSHGLTASTIDAHKDHPYSIVGIIEPMGTVIDQLLICDLESIWDAHNHVKENDEDGDHEQKEHEDHAHKQLESESEEHNEEEGHMEEDKEITSLLVKFKSPLGLVQLPRFINENTNMQAALPGFEVQRLNGLLGAGVKTINGIALSILLVSGFSIFISLLKTIRERRQELALLRTYGLGTKKLLVLVLFEGLFLAFFGFLLGWMLGRMALMGASTYIESEYGYALQISLPTVQELIFLIATLIIAVIAVICASTSIFKMNISKILADA